LSFEDLSDRDTELPGTSYFTNAVVKGIVSGRADQDGDGRITVDELYEYVYQQVNSSRSSQRPRKMTSGEGDLVVAGVRPKERPPPPAPTPTPTPTPRVTQPEEAGTTPRVAQPKKVGTTPRFTPVAQPRRSIGNVVVAALAVVVLGVAFVLFAISHRSSSQHNINPDRIVYAPQGLVGGLALSPVDDTAISGGLDGAVHHWKMDGAAEIAAYRRQITGGGAESAAISGVAFSSDGKMIAAGRDDGTISVWNTKSSKPRITVDTHLKSVSSLAFSPDGKFVAAASGGYPDTITGDQQVQLWSTDGRTSVKLTGHSNYVNGLAFNPSGTVLATASADHTVRLWDIPSGRSRAVLAGADDELYSVTFSPDGKVLASTGQYQDVLLWNVDAHTPIANLAGTGSTYAAAFSPDGRTLAIAGIPGDLLNVGLWDAISRELAQDLEGGSSSAEPTYVKAVYFSHDGRVLVVSYKDGRILMWNLRDGRVR
jgi:WD40 repeat protein